MNKDFLKPLIVFAVCVILTFIFIGLAALIRSGSGNIEVTNGFFTPEKSEAADGLPVRIAYRLYKPKNASNANPVPAVLSMHGYQNDKDTSTAFCTELARRGIAVLAIDLYGHGDTNPGMRGRGWGKYNIKNLEKPISGPKRFMVMMTFSILDFFRPQISSGVADSSMGGRSAWRFLASLPFVDSNQMALTGHSMGTWASWSVAAAPVSADFPAPRAIVIQCGEVFPRDYYDSENVKFNNVLILQALIEEFENMRDYQLKILGLEKTPVRYRDFMGQDAPVEWNRTYGSFADGSARRMELIKTNHRLVTYDNHALTTAMNWFTTALDIKPQIADTNHVQWYKEGLNFLAMLAAMTSMLPLFLILTKFKFFTPLAQPLKAEPKMLSPKKRRNNMLTAILVSGITFPFMTQLGHGLMPLPENIFRMTIGNGFITWLDFLMIIALFMMYRWYKKGEGSKLGWTLSDLGMEVVPEKSTETAQSSVSRKALIIRAVIAAFILTGSMYILTCISTAIFQLDFRIIWPFFRTFSLLRLGQFFIYLPFYVAFFTVNAGVKLYGQLRLPEYELNGKKSAAFTQLVWWGYSILVMLGGLFIIILIEYIPFFLGIGPGADLFFSSLFGGPFMSILILLVPQFAILFFYSTWFYRKSGTVYVGSFVLSILAVWVVTGGSSIF
jgi:dienelactone hydrolase